MKTYDDLIYEIGSLKNRYSILLLILLNMMSFNPDVFGILFIMLPTNFRCNWNETLAAQNLTQYIGGMDNITTLNTTGNSSSSVFDNKCSTQLSVINKTVQCRHFTYETTTSMISEFNLVCDKAYWINLIKGSFWLGYLCAAPVGLIADKFGRKITVIVLSYLFVLMYYLSAFAVAPWMYYICHFVKGFSASYLYILVILQMEISNIKSRHIIACTAWTYGTVFNVLVAPVAYLLPKWRHFELFGAVSITIMLIAPLFFPESPRWLLVTGQRQKAQQTLNWLAVKNKVKKVDISGFIMDKTNSASCKDVLHHKSMLIRILFSIFLWYSMSTIYYGISLNVNFASKNPYISHFALTVTELPVIPFSVFICWLMTYKRAMYALISLVIATLFTVYFLQDYVVLRLILGSLGKFSASVLFMIIIVFTEELYPTEFRTTGHNLTNLSRISVVIVPYIIDLKVVHGILPVIIICSIGFLMMISVMPFPETKGWPLPQKISELRKIQWSNVNQPAAEFKPKKVELDPEEIALNNEDESLVQRSI